MAYDEKEFYSQEEPAFNIKRYLFKVIMNWPFFIISLVIAFTIGYLIIRYSEPIYKVSTTLVINDDPRGISLIYPFAGQAVSQRNMQNEINTLKSYTLTLKTLSELDFDVSYVLVGRVKETKIYKPFFKVIIDTTKTNIPYAPVYLTFLNEHEILIEINDPQRVRKVIRFGETFSNENFNFKIVKENDELVNPKIIEQRIKFFFFVNDIKQLVRVYQHKLQISIDDKKSSVITLATTGPIPEKEVDYLNKLAQVYIRTNLEEKNKASENVIKFIDFQLAQVSDSLSKIEKRLQEFRNENKIFDIKVEESFSTSRLNELQTTKFVNELKLRYCKYIRNYLERKGDFKDVIAPSTFDINDPIFSAAINNLVSLYNERALMDVSQTEKSPNYKILETKIEAARKILLESLNEIENTLNYSQRVTQDAIVNEEKKLFDLPPVERRLMAIQREYDINNNIFSFLLQKRAEAGITKASNVADSKILDIARVENAVMIKPNRSRVYTLSLVLGLAVPLAIILLMEFLNNKITDLRIVSRLKKANFIGAVGHNNKESDIPVFEFPRSALAESFRGLRSNLNYLLRDKSEKIILITSTISGEGKTFCAVNLSTILAMSGKKTLLASFDLRKPKLHRYFDLPNTTGISNFLINQVSLDEIILATNINHLFLLPTGPVPPNPAELLETEKMRELIDLVKERFDYIIIDSPPIAIVADAVILSEYADATLYIARYNYSTKDVVELADELAERSQLKRVFLLINDVKVPGYYGYSSYYASRYGYTSYHYTYGYSYYAYGSDYYQDEDTPRTLKDKVKAWFGM
ncbi:MAG: polysaccharide biosynthesis tyrosine autokinase [Bacteroidales bacterium]|nr:polysaccharide biosynthesis tyrosine autokinase [Bacteroidales bacterium]